MTQEIRCSCGFACYCLCDECSKNNCRNCTGVWRNQHSKAAKVHQDHTPKPKPQCSLCQDSQVINCPDCQGKGVLIYPSSVHRGQEKEPCERCDKTGRIKCTGVHGIY